jgi:hypothetical protein
MEQLKVNEFENSKDTIEMLEKIRARFGGDGQCKERSSELCALTNCNGFETVAIQYDENRRVFYLNITNSLQEKCDEILRYIERNKCNSCGFVKLKIDGKPYNVVPNNSQEDIELLKMLAKQETEIQLNKFGLFDWKVVFQESENEIFGSCDPGNKAIILSMNVFALLDYGNIWNIIHHEVAHALAGNGHGHDEVWKQTAIMIGCDGEATIKVKELIKVDDNEYKVSFYQI